MHVEVQQWRRESGVGRRVGRWNIGDTDKRVCNDRSLGQRCERRRGLWVERRNSSERVGRV